jgi:uncharacterized protein
VSALPPSGSYGDPDHARDAVAPDGSRVVRMEPRHHDAVLVLNRRDVDVLSPMDADRLSWIVARCAVPLVVEDDEGVLGFCLALESGTDYDGVHYAWFGERYPSFLYLDRIVVSDRARRRRVGSRLYAACEDHAAALGRMVCEVNVAPENTTSLAFHAARDYVPVGRVPVGPPGDEGAKVVAMLAKELPGGS